MSYARSAAFKVLQARVAGLRRIVDASARLRIGGRRNQLYRESMLSSTVLLGFAYFEAYVSDVVDDACKSLCSGGLNASKFPSDLRVHVAIAAHIRNWVDIQDPAKQRNQINANRSAGVFDILNDADTPMKIDVAALLSGVSYPKPKNVKRLLARLGIADPKAELIARGGHSIEQKLISIHDARAELAHTGAMPAWTIADYLDRLDGLEQFARAFDKVLHRHVSALVSSSRWIT